MNIFETYLGWLETLECAPLKISSSIRPGANFGGLVWLLQKIKKNVFQVLFDCTGSF